MPPTITHPPWRTIVPLTTALFGTLATSTGLYALLNSGPNVSNLFGIQTPATVLADGEASARQKAWIRVYGLRNLVSSFSGLGLIAFWRFSALCRESRAAAEAVQKAVAIVFGVGAFVAVGDGWIVWRFGRSDGVGAEQRALAGEKASAHVGVVVPLIPLAVAWWYL